MEPTSSLLVAVFRAGVQLPQIPFLKTFAVELKMSARELFGVVHRKWIQVSLADKDFVLRQVAEDYVFKVCGLREYLYGDGELLAYDCVWRAISSGDRLSLLLVHRAALGRPSDEGVSDAGCSVVDLVWPCPSPTTAAERVTRDSVPSDGPAAGAMGPPPGANELNQALRVTLRTASGLSQAGAGLVSVALTLSHGVEEPSVEPVGGDGGGCVVGRGLRTGRDFSGNAFVRCCV
jgi:hypothetical protein